MKFSALALLLLPFATATNPTYVGYQTLSDVTEHGEIDLDMRDILADIATGDIAGAKVIYTAGANSAKTTSTR